jgi:hypothetical protein
MIHILIVVLSILYFILALILWVCAEFGDDA